MGRASVIDLVGIGLISVWLVLSVYFFAIDEAALFQRMGAIGTTVSVVYLFVQWPSPYPVGLHDKLQIVNDRLNDNSKFVGGALRNCSEVAGFLSDDLQRRGEAVPIRLERIAMRGQLELDEITGDLPYDKFRSKNVALTQESKKIDEEIQNGQILPIGFQAAIIILSTMQAGFGDLFVNQW